MKKYKKAILVTLGLMLMLIVAVALNIVPAEAIYTMPFIPIGVGATQTYNDTGRSWKDSNREFTLTRDVIVTAAAAAGEIYQALSIPAGTLVTGVKCIIISAGTTAGSFDVDIGDGSSDNGWDDAIDVTAAANTVTASLEGTDAYGPGKYYAAADTIDVLVANDNSSVGATIRVIAFCVEASKDIGSSTVAS